MPSVFTRGTKRKGEDESHVSPAGEWSRTQTKSPSKRFKSNAISSPKDDSAVDSLHSPKSAEQISESLPESLKTILPTNELGAYPSPSSTVSRLEPVGKEVRESTSSQPLLRIPLLVGETEAQLPASSDSLLIDESQNLIPQTRHPSPPPINNSEAPNRQNAASPNGVEAEIAPAPAPSTRPNIEYIHDSKYYFDDGDIILVVDHTLFRVHIDMLKSVGGFFEEVFSLPQPPNAETINGVPSCNLFDLASSEDIHCLLALIYEDIILSNVDDEDEDYWLHFDNAMTLLDVSHKFNLADIRVSAINALELLFPWDLHLCHARPMIGGVKTIEEKELFLRRFPIQAVNLFRKWNLSAMMPMAYYRAAQLSIKDIVTGVPIGDNAKVTLCPHDMLKILEGRELLKHSRRKTLFGWLNDLTSDGKPKKLSPLCYNIPHKTGDTCFYFLLRMYLDFNRAGFLDTKPDGLKPLHEVSQKMLEEHLCEHCLEEVEDKLQEGMEDNWQRTPTYFGFTGWEAVMKMQQLEEETWVTDRSTDS